MSSSAAESTGVDMNQAANISANFQIFRQQLDERVNLNESVVKVGRDVTIESKRVIFHLHRYHGNNEADKKKEVMREAEEKINLIVDQHFRKIANLLHKVHDPATFARAYSNGLQEFIEAISFKYLLEREEKTPISNVGDLLLPYEDVKKMLTFKMEEGVEFELLVRFSDYILGIADTTGEAMRMCVKQISSVRQPQDLINSCSYKLCAYVRMLHSLFTFLHPVIDLPAGLKKQFGNKLDVLENSLKKCEDQCSQSCMLLHEDVSSLSSLEPTHDPFQFRQFDEI